MEKKTEKQVREEAQKLARKIGDEEWEKGETKYAFEAYEASDITASELLEKAEKLLEAEKIAEEWKNARTTAQKLPYTGHESFKPECKCLACKTQRDMAQTYESRIRELLGWKEKSDVDPNYGFHYRAAAVACFKVIKRMLPEEKE